MPLRVDHANLVVRDIEAQTAFYCDLLGFTVVLAGELSGAWIDQVIDSRQACLDCVILDSPGGGARLELLRYRHPAAVAVDRHGEPSGLGLRHLAFAVDDLDELVERLRQAGVELLSEPVTVPFPVAGQRKRLVYFRDPEGVLLELAEYR